MEIKLYNTFTKKIEEFKPIKPGFVGMYTCGPTVYGPGHLGHARSYVNFDLLKRMFLYNGYKVKHILNITDVHDDMINRANELGVTIFELADKYTPLFFKDLEELNIIPADVYPKVTEHIPEIIEMTQAILERGFAYLEKDGSVYYDVSKFDDYGRLSGIRLDKAKTGTRVETDKYEKEDVADFALWKGWKKEEPYWESPWGKGRPGWHIECSVMANKYLGKTIDLHGGAMDLKFPHHENEIAQSEAANGVKFVNYWFHVGLLEVEGQKMSKSLGNYIEIHEVQEKGFDPLALRYLFLTAHYRSKLNFTWKGLEAAANALEKLRNVIAQFIARQTLKDTSDSGRMSSSEVEDYRQRFLSAINNDLKMPEALVVVWDLVKSDFPDEDKLNLLLDFDQVLGLELGKVPEKEEIPAEVEELVKRREKLRKQKKWQEADEIRRKVEKLGWQIEDTERGSKLKKDKDYYVI